MDKYFLLTMVLFIQAVAFIKQKTQNASNRALGLWQPSDQCPLSVIHSNKLLSAFTSDE